MKSLAIIGMMFCSVGLFAQQQGAVTPKKEKMCRIERPVSNERVQSATTPARNVQSRKGLANLKRDVPAKKAHVRDEHAIRNGANVKAKQ